MNRVLAFIEIRNGEIQPISFEIMGAARQLADLLGAKVDALALGGDAEALAPELTCADAIVSISHDALRRYVPEAALAALVEVVNARSPLAVVFAYDTAGLDLAPALALCTGRAQIGYVQKLGVEGGEILTEAQAHGGKLLVSARAPLPAVITIMPGAFAEAEPLGLPEIVEFPAPARLDVLRTQFVSEAAPDLTGFDLAAADKIVCVGRGVKDKDTLAAAHDMATALGAEIAGSRPIIDSGWLPKERQVGKSGRKVKPKLYIALGVSGAPEHLEGMSGAELIVAVNTDEKAPIFGSAHFGANCDVKDLVAALSGRLNASRA
jgi:electron transfer flavoprotein alpha subunit